MTREDALLKLLAVEPETKDMLILATGWDVTETLGVLEDLVQAGKVAFTRENGYDVARRRYYVVRAR